MSILNYLFIGIVLTFFLDYVLANPLRNHPNLKDIVWGLRERIICVLIWPVALLVFSYSFFKEYFK